MTEQKLYKVGEKGDFAVYFEAVSQSYSVFKSGELLLSKKYKFSEVKTYIS